MTSSHRARLAVAGTIALVLGTAGCDAGLPDAHSSRDDPGPSDVSALFTCDRLYKWRDQSYAFAEMQASLCITTESAIRARSFSSPESALVALNDEIGVLPDNAEIAVAEKMYVAAPAKEMTHIIAAYPQLQRVSRDDVLTSDTPPRDERDVCVGMLAAHFETAVDGDDGDLSSLSGYADLYPDAVRAASTSAKVIEAAPSERERLAQLRRDDPFAYDVWLSEQVSPLKSLCAHASSR